MVNLEMEEDHRAGTLSGQPKFSATPEGIPPAVNYYGKRKMLPS
jgi:hypothetical protein